jgi:hypothetical protein
MWNNLLQWYCLFTTSINHSPIWTTWYEYAFTKGSAKMVILRSAFYVRYSLFADQNHESWATLLSLFQFQWATHLDFFIWICPFQKVIPDGFTSLSIAFFLCSQSQQTPLEVDHLILIPLHEGLGSVFSKPNPLLKMLYLHSMNKFHDYNDCIILFLAPMNHPLIWTTWYYDAFTKGLAWMVILQSTLLQISPLYKYWTICIWKQPPLLFQ